MISQKKLLLLATLILLPSVGHAAKREALICDFENTKKEVVLEGGKRLLEKSNYFVVVSGPRAMLGLRMRGQVNEKKIVLNAKVMIPVESLIDGSVVEGPAIMYLYSRRGEVLITYVSLDPDFVPLSYGAHGNCELAS